MTDADKTVAVAAPPTERDKRGIECPKCGCRHLFVVYTRATTQSRLMRRRECRHCGRRVTTYERIP